MLEMIVSLIETVAECGAGFLSYGATYEPEVPEELKED